jgi:hypothetical protein
MVTSIATATMETSSTLVCHNYFCHWHDLLPIAIIMVKSRLPTYNSVSASLAEIPASTHLLPEIVCEGWVLKKRRKKMQGECYCLNNLAIDLIPSRQGLHVAISLCTTQESLPTLLNPDNLFATRFLFIMPPFRQPLVVRTYISIRIPRHFISSA